MSLAPSSSAPAREAAFAIVDSTEIEAVIARLADDVSSGHAHVTAHAKARGAALARAAIELAETTRERASVARACAADAKKTTTSLLAADASALERALERCERAARALADADADADAC